MGKQKPYNGDSNTENLVTMLNRELGLFLSICFGIFLFILFFKPFPINNLDPDNKLVFIGGFAGIVFLLMFLLRIAGPLLFPGYSDHKNGKRFPAWFNGIILLILCSTAFAFYLAYVGYVVITFYLMMKVVLICLAPPVILALNDTIEDLRIRNLSLTVKNRNLLQQIDRDEENRSANQIELTSENSNEHLTLKDTEIMLIRSADNYAEVVYRDGDQDRKKLIRNTLKNIEYQLRPFPVFMRCHRNCIVNILFIDGLTRSFHNHLLHIKQSEETIPVSRQYLIKIKEALHL